MVPRHKLNDIMETKTRFWKWKRVSVSRFHGDPFTSVVRESGNRNVFPFPISIVIHLLTLLGCDFFAPIADLPISTYRPESFVGFVKNKLPGNLYFLSRNSSSVLYAHTLYPGASQYIAYWSDSSWFFVGF